MRKIKINQEGESRWADVTAKFNDWCHYNAVNKKSQLFGRIKTAGGKMKESLYTHWQEEVMGAECSLFTFTGYFIQCNDDCTIHYFLN